MIVENHVDAKLNVSCEAVIFKFPSVPGCLLLPEKVITIWTFKEHIFINCARYINSHRGHKFISRREITGLCRTRKYCMQLLTKQLRGRLSVRDFFKKNITI